MRTLRQVFQDPGILDEVSNLGSRLIFLDEDDKQQVIERIGQILAEAKVSPDSEP